MQRFEINGRKPSAFDVAPNRVVSQTLADQNRKLHDRGGLLREFLAPNPEVEVRSTRQIPLPFLSNRFNFQTNLADD
jgi:hypothetical protein